MVVLYIHGTIRNPQEDSSIIHVKRVMPGPEVPIPHANQLSTSL